MKDVAGWALNIAALRGASYADARIVDDRSRALSTKNGRVGTASDGESLGIGVRVLADGAWGFAASDDLGRPAVESAAAQAVEIAKSLGAGQAVRCAAGAGEGGHGRMGDAFQDRSILNFRGTKH